MLQERWKTRCLSKGLVCGTLIVERLNIYQEEKNSGIWIGGKQDKKRMPKLTV